MTFARYLFCLDLNVLIWWWFVCFLSQNFARHCNKAATEDQSAITGKKPTLVRNVITLHPWVFSYLEIQFKDGMCLQKQEVWVKALRATWSVNNDEVGIIPTLSV